MQPFLSSSEQEITLLKQMIGNLLEQIEQIKDDNRFLLEQIIANDSFGFKTGEGETANQAFRSLSEQRIRLNWMIQSYQQQQIGTKRSFQSNTEQEIGTKQSFQSNDESGIGAKRSFGSNDDSGIEAKRSFQSNHPEGEGTKQIIDSETEQGLTAKRIIQSEPEQGVAANQVISSALTLPDTIEQNGLNQGILINAMKGAFPSKAKGSTAINTARMLLFLHNNRHATRQELQKASGMSTGGFAKRFSVVCKLGWIMRQSHMKYVLAPSGVDLLRKAFGK